VDHGSSLRLGFELELLAPPGSSRLELGRAIAASLGGRVERGFHLDAEPSKASGVALFHHLTPSFTVFGADGSPVCTLVDDITIRDDLDAAAAPEPGWYRIVSDDRRLLRLVAQRCDVSASIEDVLAPIADVWGAPITEHGGFHRVEDDHGATIAIAAPLPGERHRPCEIVTVPIESDHEARLEQLLAPARDLGFTIPAEAAVHLHADASLVRDPRVLRNLVRILQPYADVLRWLVGTNPRCRRLGPLPSEVEDLVESPGFAGAGWADVRSRLAELPLTKYADVNLRNVVSPPVGKDTIEWRILPGAIDAGPVLESGRLFEAILTRAGAADPPAWLHHTVDPGWDGAELLFAELGLPLDGRWLSRQVIEVGG
jgi:hypothetical protein